MRQYCWIRPCWHDVSRKWRKVGAAHRGHSSWAVMLVRGGRASSQVSPPAPPTAPRTADPGPDRNISSIDVLTPGSGGGWQLGVSISVSLRTAICRTPCSRVEETGTVAGAVASQDRTE